MRHTERGQAIAFLLSFGAIPLGCPAEDDGESDTNATAPTTTAGSTAATTAGTDDSDTSMSSSASSSASSMTSTTDSSTASTTVSTDATDVSVGTDPDTGYGTYGSGGEACKGIEIPEICTQLGAHYSECFPKLRRYYAQAYAEYCACMITYYGPMYGPYCATALEDYFACLTGVPCELMGGDACPAEEAAMVTACGGGEDSGSGGGE